MVKNLTEIEILSKIEIVEQQSFTNDHAGLNMW